jgi:hypothetical protein
MIGKARMEMKVGLTFACMNLKKLAMMMRKRGLTGPHKKRQSFKNLILDLVMRKATGFRMEMVALSTV